MTGDESTNWGRWGPADERGTLNLITPEHVRAAAGLVRRGKVYSLALTLHRDAPTSRRPLWHFVGFGISPEPPYVGYADDVITMHTHGTTHVDALSHVFYDNRMYNGYRVDENLSTGQGAVRNGVENMVSIVGRGVLLDVARHRGVEHLGKEDEVGPEELDECAREHGVEIRSGDTVLIRTGWLRVFARDRALYESGAPGATAEVAAWFKQHDVCAIGADTISVEKHPSPAEEPIVFHRKVIRDFGGYVMEYLDLEELAADGTYEFLFIAAPLRLVHGIGSPLNPLAIS